MCRFQLGGIAMQIEKSAERHGRSNGSLRSLIICESIVTGIVVASIVERAGLLAVKTRPETAMTELERINPQLVIIEETLGPVIENLVCRGAGRPYLIGVNLEQRVNGKDTRFDAVVHKPVTVEALQPVISRFLKTVGSRS